jgi:hypothetical protein
MQIKLYPKLALSIFCATLLFSCSNKKSEVKTEEENLSMFYDNQARYKQEFEMTKDPNTGKIPVGKLYEAMGYTQSLKNSLSPLTEGIVWQERGPSYDSVGPSNGNRRGATPPYTEGYTSGRINTLIIDAADATGNTVLTGGVTGGIWRCTNFLSGSIPNWVSVNDFLSNMNMVWLCQDPTNTNIMYCATGEAFNNSGAVRGNGLFKSTDRGLTWVQLPSTAGITRSFKVECDASGNVYYATAGSGLLRSSNGGSSWTTITPSSTSTTCVDFELTSTGALHASFGFFGTTVFYRYTTNPATVTAATWQRGNGIRASATSTIRMDLAAQGNVVYAITVNSAYNVDSCYKSTDGGANWTLTNASILYTTGIANGQGWKNIILEINPNNTNEIIMGGLDAYRSTNSGSSVSRITYWVSSSPYVHADHHFFKWYTVGSQTRMIMGGDGGIYYSNNNAVSFIDKNRNLNIKQFYSCAIHPTETNYFLAGAQDNGSHQLRNEGVSYSREVTGGDGCFVFIDQQNPTYQFTTYVYNALRRSTNNFSSINSFNLSSGGSFVNPMDYDAFNKKLYTNNSSGNMVRWDNPASTSSSAITTSITFTGITTSALSAFTVSKFSTVGAGGTRLYFGSAGKIYRLLGADTVSTNATAVANTTNISGTSFPTGTLRCIAEGATANDLIAVFSNYGISNVWISNNGGTSWTAIDGNLPDMPVRWAVYHPTINNRILLATEAGVYYTLNANGSSTQWLPSAGFPMVRTDMFRVRASDNTIVAATYGRGLWTGNLLNILPLKKINLNLQSVKDNTVQLQWNAEGANSKTKFTLQASNDGINFFNVSNTEAALFNYQHKVNIPILYYRVVGSEPNVSTVVSNVVVAKANLSTQTNWVNLVSNPVKNMGDFIVFSKQNAKVNWQILGLNGSIYKTGSFSINANNTIRQNFNASNLSNGMYILKLEMGGEIFSKKFVKQ